jgi:hypothetical protein
VDGGFFGDEEPELQDEDELAGDVATSDQAAVDAITEEVGLDNRLLPLSLIQMTAGRLAIAKVCAPTLTMFKSVARLGGSMIGLLQRKISHAMNGRISTNHPFLTWSLWSKERRHWTRYLCSLVLLIFCTSAHT